MTVNEAYRIIGVSNGSSRSQIECAYKAKCQKLQRQLVAGQSLTTRQKAEQQISELAAAWDVLKNTPPQGSGHSSTHKQAQTQPQQAGSPLPPLGRQQNRCGSPTAMPLTNHALVVSFVIAAVVMLFVIVLCVNASVNHSKSRMAQLRVLSVPWCNVKVDGKKLGPSGQAKVFKVVEGKHKLKLQRGNRVLTKKIQLIRDRQTTVRVQFEKGWINVSHR